MKITNIGALIQKYKEEEKLSMESLSNLTGISKMSLYKYIRSDIENMSVNNLIKLMDALNISPVELFRDDAKPSAKSIEHELLADYASKLSPEQVSELLQIAKIIFKK